VVTETKDNTICVVAICRNCRGAVIYKYMKDGEIGISLSGLITFSGTSFNRYDSTKPDIEWCPECKSDIPRYLCKVTNEELPGLEEKCENCEFRFACASSRIEVIYEGVK